MPKTHQPYAEEEKIKNGGYRNTYHLITDKLLSSLFDSLQLNPKRWALLSVFIVFDNATSSYSSRILNSEII